jgi:hypothetical protein
VHIENFILCATGGERYCMRSSEEALRPECLRSVDIGNFLDWYWTGVVEMLEWLTSAGDLPDLHHDVHIVVLSTGHVKSNF